MKKAITVFVFIIAVIILIIPATAYGENNSEDFERKIRLNSSGATLRLNDEFSFYENEDGSVELHHISGLFSAVISCDNMDNETLELLRKYYNDYTSDENYMFNRFIEFGKSFYNSMEELFRSNFLYPGENSLEETNMKIFGQYTENSLGKGSYSVIYNTIYSNKADSLENTHINIGIPVYPEKTVYTISFTCQRGALDNYVIERMLSLVNSLEIPGAYSQVKTLNVFRDVHSIDLANRGIYPDLDVEGITYNTYMNQNGGYSIKYPSTFVPYRINNITSAMNYVSFKINYNHTVSITAEKLQQPLYIDDILEMLKNSKRGSIKIQEEGTLNTGENGKKFNYMKYEINSPEGRTYVQDYFIINNSILYNIKLESRFLRPSDVIEKTLYNILKSLQFTGGSMRYPAEISHASSRFTNKDDGFTLLYPKDWKIIRNESSDFRYDSFILKPPGNSSALEVMLAESQLSDDVPDYYIKYLCANENPLIIKYISNGYKTPYPDDKFTALYTSSYELGDTLFVKRLVNYLDDAGRTRMCYSTDIIKGRNIYSLFISAPDYVYSSEAGQLNDNTTAVANLISNYFRLVNTPGYDEAQKDEIDKKSALFAKCILYLKEVLGTDIKGYFPHYDMLEPVSPEKSEYYVTVYVEFYNTSGYFDLLVNTVDDTITPVKYTPTDSIQKKY